MHEFPDRRPRGQSLPAKIAVDTRGGRRGLERIKKKTSVSPLIQFLISARGMIGGLGKWEP